MSIKILVIDNIRKSIDLLEERVEILGWRKIRVNVLITDTLLPMLEGWARCLLRNRSVPFLSFIKSLKRDKVTVVIKK